MLDIIDRPTPATEDTTVSAAQWGAIITAGSPALNALQAECDEACAAARSRAADLMPSLLAAVACDAPAHLNAVLDEVMEDVMKDVMPAPLIAEAMILLLAGALVAARAGR